jgi:polynucleotide 5'-kinase involved in rRNA processing
MEPALDLPPEWIAALARAGAARTILVLGPTDAGKSSFIRALAERRPGLCLLDLDPGQKMVGPPGTASLGSLLPAPKLERFVFLGSTAIGSFRQLLAAAARLLPAARGRPLVVNTSGYVAGPGARLQLLTLETLRPDLVVAIALAGPLAGAVEKVAGPRLVRLARAAAARRKSEGRRRAIRRQGLADALAGAEDWSVPPGAILFEPAPPLPFPADRLPVCALADEAGEDMELGVLCADSAEEVLLWSRRPARPVARLRLGRMWASRRDGEILLLDALAPSWDEGRTTPDGTDG